jgi:hypothetical protein
MTMAQYFFMIFKEYDSSMYEELGMVTRHVVQGSRVVVFQMDSWDVLQVDNFLWVPGLCSQPH